MLVDIKLVEKYLIPSLIHATYPHTISWPKFKHTHEGWNIVRKKEKKKSLGNNDFRKYHSTLTISPHWLI